MFDGNTSKVIMSLSLFDILTQVTGKAILMN